MLKLGFKIVDIAPCLFIKEGDNELVIVAIYVDDLNLLRMNKIIVNTITMLKSMFEMRDLGKTSLCIGLQFEPLPTEILLHQSTTHADYYNNFVCIQKNQ
jgi:hypothetical protein